MILYYVRHGDPIYEPDSLTELGKRQAEAIGRRIARYPIDEIYASDSVRAMETARPLTEILKKDMELLPWANEYLAWQQLSVTTEEMGPHWFFVDPVVKDLFVSPEMMKLGLDWYEHPMFKGTEFERGYLRIRRETRAFLEKQGFVYDEQTGKYRVVEKNEKRIAIFAHQGFGMGFLSTVLNIPYPVFCEKFDLSHSTLQVITFDTTEDTCVPVCITHGNDAHLYSENLPTRFDNKIYY